jgi:hypothetical protein
MVHIQCSECGSPNVICLETGIKVISIKFHGKLNGDLFKCTSCGARFITGLGDRAKEWDD